MPFPLVTERLMIRPFELSDTEAFHRILGDPEVMENIPGGASPSLAVTRSKVRKIIGYQKKHGLSMWAIFQRETGRLIGDCGLILVEGKGPEIELTYDIARSEWGKGYATEASKACLTYGFQELGLEEIIAITYPPHRVSRRVMEKAGMTYRRNQRYYDHEMVVYSLTVDEFRGLLK